MKQLLTAAMLLLISCNLFSQLSVTDSFNITRERWRDSTFRIDKSQISTGILTEFSLAPFETNKYDGINNDDDTIKNTGQWLMLHNILTESKVNTNAAINPTDSLYRWASNHYNTTQQMPFLFLFKTYNRIRQTALSEGLFTIDADSVGILDASGRTTSPYDTYKIFAFAPFNAAITQFNAVHFAFPSNLWETNNITSLSINFDDGVGFRTINQNDSINIYYPTEGIKTLTAQVIVSGVTYTAHCIINYLRPSVFSQPSYQWAIDTTRIYGNDADYLGNTVTTFGLASNLIQSSTGAKVLVENGCDGVFDKPVIIVEGFDPGNKITTEKLKDRFRYQSFISTLKAYGYDLVIVNLNNNYDYIENNARVLEAVINKVNQTKTGTHKISIIGFSMGGLVARWCLKDMEDRNLTHNVDKYFSYDAPHQGANIPLGCQYLFKEIIRDLPYLKWLNFGNTDDYPGLGDQDEAFNSSAGRQMLVTKASYGNGPFNWNPNLITLDELRASFAARLQTKGYPQQTTNFGISFGNGNNTANTKNAGNGKQWGNFNAGDEILNITGIYLLVNFTGKVNAVPENGNTASIGNYRFFGWTWRKIFGPFGVWLPTLRVRNFNYTGQYPYDDAPGGNDITQSLFAYSIVRAAGSGTTNGHDFHNFIPLVSALDLQNQNYSATNDWQSANLFYNIDNNIVSTTGTGGTLSTPSLSPFSQVCTYSFNLRATTNYNRYHNDNISYESADFIIKNILGFTPSRLCQTDDFCDKNPAISGPTVVCSTGNFSVNSNDVKDLTLNWSSMHGSFRITNGQGTNQITISKNYNAADTLILSLTNSCGTTRVIKLGIQVGLLYSGFNISTYPYPEPECFELWSIHTFQATLAYGQNPTGWQWGYRIVGVTGDIIYPYNSEFFTLIPEQEGTYEIFVRPINDCGPGFPETIKTITVSSACAGSFGRFAASPNPTTGDVQIETIGTDKKTSIKEIQVTDKYGNIKKTIKLNTSPKKHKINIADLPADVYIIRIYDGKTWVSKKVIKS